MAASPYDPDHDGRCDSQACAHVTNVYLDMEPQSRLARMIANNLRLIGIGVRNVPFAHPGDLQRAMQPDRRASMYTMDAWVSDYPDASTLFVSRAYGPSITPAANLDFALIGATGDELSRWGYPVTSVPGVDQRVRDCVSMEGTDRTVCWAMLDRYLMLRVVPWVPVLSQVRQEVTSARVRNFLFDPWTGLPAPDQIMTASA